MIPSTQSLPNDQHLQIHGHRIKIPLQQTYQWPQRLTAQADYLRSACGTDPSHSRILFPKAPGEISIYGVEFRLRCRGLGHLVVSTIIPNCLFSTLVLLVVKNWIGKGLFSYYVRYRSCAWQLVRLSFPTGKGTLLLVQNEQKSPVLPTGLFGRDSYRHLQYKQKLCLLIWSLFF